MSFDELVVREHPTDEGLWIVARTFSYRGHTARFTVPRGFVTDFASVPRFLWWLFPPYGKHTRAAVVHDWLYSSHVTSRADADGLFRRMMKELGVSACRRWLMFFAVRLFGFLAWRKR